MLTVDPEPQVRNLRFSKVARIVFLVSTVSATFLFALTLILLLDFAKSNDVQFGYNYITGFSFFSFQAMYATIVGIFYLALFLGLIAWGSFLYAFYFSIRVALKGEKWHMISRATLIALFSTELFLLFESVFYYIKLFDLTHPANISNCSYSFNSTSIFYNCKGHVVSIALNRLNYVNDQLGQFSGLALAFLVPFLVMFFLTNFRFLGNQNLLEYTIQRTYVQHPPQSEPVATGFSPQLSGLRGSAALGVAVLHTIVFLNIVTPLAYFTNTLFVGVPLFLMLSMSLLLSSLQKNYNLKRYFKRRVLRIWPIYFGCLIVFYLFFGMPYGQLVSFSLFIQYFANPGGGIKVASSFWTLQIEEFAYIFIPLIALLNRSQKRYLAALMIAIGASSFVIYYSPFISTGENQIQIIQSCLLPYGLGLLAFSTRIDRRFRLLVPIGLTLLTVQNAGILAGQIPLTLFGYFLILAGFAACLRYPPKFLGYLAFLGESSYALYAIHVAFILTFGIVGLFLAIPSAFAIEFALRRKEIIKRLKIAYSVRSPDRKSPEIVIPPTLTQAQSFRA
jgi:peptidoglycan/LPS O-acetylase OafA/YrhL